MPFVLFHDYFLELAEQETRQITILDKRNRWNLPPGCYGFMEMFCDEAGCDCRRAFLCVGSSTGRVPLAVISYGWEEPRFYARWLTNSTPGDVREMKGPALNSTSPQSELAPALLRLAEEVLLQDRDYVERLKRHYSMFRSAIDGGRTRVRKQPRALWRRRKPVR